MFRGLYTSYTGMKVQQQRVDAISNNIANVNTNGYKRDRLIEKSFKEVLTTRIRDGKSDTRIGKMSLGVSVAEVFTDFSQGSLKQTNNELDIAIAGRGFFKLGVPDKSGNMAIKYTRDGSFTLDSNKDLCTKDGKYVLSESGDKINLAENALPRINKDGSVYLKEKFIAKLGVVDFADEKMLKKEGDSMFVVPDNAETRAFEGSLEQGFLEGSGVNSVQEMINLITANRIYEANQKVIQTYDETMSKVVNEVGSVK